MELVEQSVDEFFLRGSEPCRLRTQEASTRKSRTPGVPLHPQEQLEVEQ